MGLFSSISKGFKKISKPLIGAGIGYLTGGTGPSALSSAWQGAIGGAASAYGATEQNKANSAQALKQMEFQSDQANISREFSAHQASLQRRFAKNAAGRQMKFQKDQSGTQYSRAYKDMKRAGINPILAAGGGSAAAGGASGSSGQAATSAPSGAQASLVDEATPAIHSAMSVKKTQAEIKQIEMQTKFTEAQKNALGIKSSIGEAGEKIFDNISDWGTNSAGWLKDRVNRIRGRYRHNDVHKKKTYQGVILRKVYQ